MNNTITPDLSDDELDELGSFLLSEATSDETMMPDCLDGFLTAVASSPAMPGSSVWMPRIWGPSASDEPVFETHAQMMRITGLIMRHFESIVARLEQNYFEPIFDSAVYPDSDREYIDGEMWAYGYMKGVNLNSQDWQPLADELRPIYLLGSEEASEEDELLVETPLQREELSKQIPAAVASIYRYLQLHKKPAPPVLPELPKVGRNELCPCGSGRKYKKCCAAPKK